MKEILKSSKIKKIDRKVQLVTRSVLSTLFVIMASCSFVLASGTSSDNPAAEAISNFTEIIVGIVTAIGVILAIWGVVQVGLSVPSHDTSQRASGFLALAGGIIVAVAPHIVVSILNGNVDSQYMSGLPQSGGSGSGGH
jgi:hypothetical protein